MKRFLLLSMFVLMFSTPVQAESPAAGEIAIVDMQQIMRDSKAAKSVQKQITSVREKYKNTISSQEKDLTKMKDDLVAKKATLSAEDFQTQRKDFEQKLVSVQKDVREKQNKLDDAFNEAMDKIRMKSVEIIAAQAKKHNASLVLPRQNIIIVDQSLDLTEEVMAELDKALTDVKVKVD